MENPLSNSENEVSLALQLLKDDRHQSITEVLDENQKDKNITFKDFSITGSFTHNPKANLPLYNKDVKTKVLDDSTYNLYHISFKDDKDKPRKIVIKTEEKYDDQTHVIVSDTQNSEEYIIELKQPQKDTIRLPHIRFHHSRPQLKRNQCLPVTLFEKNDNTYNIKYLDENNNTQHISISSNLDYQNESFAIVKEEASRFIFLELPSADKGAALQPTESPVIHEESKEIIEADSSAEKELTSAMLETFKEILQEERERLQKEEEPNKQKTITDAIVQAHKLDKKLNDQKSFNQKQTYIIGTSIAIIFIAIMTYMYKYNQLPESIVNLFNKILPTH